MRQLKEIAMRSKITVSVVLTGCVIALIAAAVIAEAFSYFDDDVVVLLAVMGVLLIPLTLVCWVTLVTDRRRFYFVYGVALLIGGWGMKSESDWGLAGVTAMALGGGMMAFAAWPIAGSLLAGKRDKRPPPE